MSNRLTPEDWIKAAFRRLGQGGIAAVRAEVLARDLGVSKGSFYWHFKDLPDLKARMLAHWQDQATARIVALAEAAGADPAARLDRLIDLATSELDAPYGGFPTEAAIRDWARSDPAAAAAQAATDAARFAYLQSLMAEAGAEPPERAARLLLMAYVGAVHQNMEDRARLAADLRALLAALLGPSGRG
ncbi:MAG: TetR/AcrR family transcriptional regulator [Gemmobacter sp.]